MDWPFDGQTLDEKQDLFEEILSWLPPKSLYRFKSVNRTWNRIITSLLEQPRFVLKQVSNAQKRTISPATTLISWPGRTLPNNLTRDLRITFLTLLRGGQPSQLSTPILPILDGFDSGSIKNCYHCNGILCLVDYFGRLLLWNPGTRQHRLVPDRITNPYPPPLEEGVALGCDSGGTEYKIVAMHSVLKFGSDKTTVKWFLGAEVFRLSTDSWTTVPCDENRMPNDVYWWSEGVCHDGFCFWLVGCLKPDSVLCFDVLRETFQSLELPPQWADYFPYGGGFNRPWKLRFSTWRGCPAVLVSYVEKGVGAMRRVDAWVMEGIESWGMCLSLGPFTATWSPLTLLNRDEVLMVYADGGIGVYDGGTILRRRLSIDMTHCISCGGLFVETLASIF